MSQLTFVPRKLAKKKTQSQPQALNSSIKPQTVLAPPIAAKNERHDIVDHKELDDQSLAVLMCISMSDYSLWSNHQLLSIASENDGFIPILQVLQMSSIFEYLPSLPHETSIVGAIRKGASETLEARMVVSSPSYDPWSTNSQLKEESSGYEVRRKDWGPYKRHHILSTSQVHWDSRTAYVENLPRNVRSHAEICSFLLGITPRETRSLSKPLIESVIFPPHHDDEHSSILPRCKGFALIVFSSPGDAEELLHRWPWQLSSSTKETPETVDVLAAKEAGFRSLSKSRWEDLKNEYLAYQRALLDALLEEDNVYSYDVDVNDGDPSSSPKQLPPHIEAEKYPKDCLVFIRNLHPGTNKTSLRTLFSLAFVNGEVGAIDYVDFNKGMDTCYLRLSKPEYARGLVEYFTDHKLVQTSEGSTPATKGLSPIAVQLVQSEKERLYWDKVPDNIRKAALLKTKPAPSSLQGDPTKPSRQKRRKRR